MSKTQLTPEQLGKRKTKNKRIWIGVGIAAAFFVGIAAGGGGDSSSATSAASAPTSTVTVTAAAPEPAPAATVTAPAATVTVTAQAAAAVVEEKAPGTSVGNGQWLVGKDIQPGTYRSPGVTGSLCYADTNDGADNINQQEVTPEGPTVITVKASDKVLKVSGCEDFVLQ